MEIISLKCNNCGADLSVNENTKFLTCSSCGSSLAVKKTQSATFTEVLSDIHQNTEKIIDQTQESLVEKKIARLDREWLLEREKYAIHSKKGITYPEKSSASNIGIIAFLGFLALCLFASYLTFPNRIGKINSYNPFDYPAFIFFFIFIIALITAAIAYSKVYYVPKVKKYTSAKNTYLQKRKELVTSLVTRQNK